MTYEIYSKQRDTRRFRVEHIEPVGAGPFAGGSAGIGAILKKPAPAPVFRPAPNPGQVTQPSAPAPVYRPAPPSPVAPAPAVMPYQPPPPGTMAPAVMPYQPPPAAPSAGAPAATPAQATPAQAPPAATAKSKLPIYIGVAGGLGIAAFFLLRGAGRRRR